MECYGSGVFGGNVAGMYQSSVFALAVDSTNTLYVGGEFLSAGNKTSPYIAKCNLNSVACRQPWIVKASPACGLTFDYRSNTIHCMTQSTTAVSYRIYTLAGREVYHDAAALPAGTNSLRIKTTGLCRSMYIGQVSVGKESVRFKMMIENR